MSPTTTFGSEITVDAGGAILAEGKRKVVKARELRSAVVMVFLNKSGLGTTLVKVCLASCHGEGVLNSCLGWRSSRVGRVRFFLAGLLGLPRALHR
jgi:hypothetical protein